MGSISTNNSSNLLVKDKQVTLMQLRRWWDHQASTKKECKTLNVYLGRSHGQAPLKNKENQLAVNVFGMKRNSMNEAEKRKQNRE